MNVTVMILIWTVILFLLAGRLVLLAFRFKNRKSTSDKVVRQKRIKNASLMVQCLLGLSLLLGVCWVVAFLFGWPLPGHDKIRIVISHSHIYTSPAEMPPAIFALWLVKAGLGIASAVVLFALFHLYGRGILFSARNVLFIRFFGYWIIIDWIIDYQMQGALRDMDLSLTPVFGGLLIIFIAWIMDEGRKIQEEQELTV
jgi:hypothetical protein